MRGGDTIVLTHPVPAVEAALQTLLEAEAAWPQGLQASEQSEEQTTFKLRVNPWTADGHAGAAARELVCAVLETMHAVGWELTQETWYNVVELYCKATIGYNHIRAEVDGRRGPGEREDQLARLGFARIVIPEVEAPNLLANLV